MEGVEPFQIRLDRRGYLNGGFTAAVQAVDRSRMLPAALAAHACLDAPLPLTDAPFRHVGLSPGAAVLLLLALDVKPGHHVLIVGADPYPAALARHVVGNDGRVTLAPPDGIALALARERLDDADVDVTPSPPWAAETWDRVLLLDERLTLPTSLRASLRRTLGTAVARTPRNGALEVVRILRNDAEYVELHLGDLVPASDAMGDGERDQWPLRRILALEEALRRGWTGRPGTHEEAEFQRAVDETWRREAPPGVEDPAWARARGLFHAGYVRLLAGDLENAEDAFRASLAEVESAEAHTFLGWTWSFSGRIEDAIAACRRAVTLDPEFGNAYNDIGAYLLELGRIGEAEPWLRKAIGARRYGARAYPYANLARVRLLRGDREGARRALEAAIREDPHYHPAREILRLLDAGDL